MWVNGRLIKAEQAFKRFLRGDACAFNFGGVVPSSILGQGTGYFCGTGPCLEPDESSSHPHVVFP
jgi:hypothetical protein